MMGDPRTDRALLIDLRERVAALERAAARRHLRRGDAEALEQLLPAIGGAVGSDLFTTAELFGSPAPGLAVVLAHLSRKAAGRLFQRAAGCDVGGYVISREGNESGAALWCVRKVVSEV